MPYVLCWEYLPPTWKNSSLTFTHFLYQNPKYRKAQKTCDIIKSKSLSERWDWCHTSGLVALGIHWEYPKFSTPSKTWNIPYKSPGPNEHQRIKKPLQRTQTIITNFPFHDKRKSLNPHYLLFSSGICLYRSAFWSAIFPIFFFISLYCLMSWFPVALSITFSPLSHELKMIRLARRMILMCLVKLRRCIFFVLSNPLGALWLFLTARLLDMFYTLAIIQFSRSSRTFFRSGSSSL